MNRTSIIIPSLRPNMLEDCLTLIGINTTMELYQIVVVSPFEVIHPRVTWVKDTSRLGVVNAMNMGYVESHWENIVILSDECRVFPRWLTNMREFMANKDENVVGAFEVIPWFNYEYYGKKFAAFPYISRKIVNDVGAFPGQRYHCIFDPAYRSFYADPDLSLRLIEKGYKIETCFGAYIESPYYEDEVHMQNENNHRIKDREVFKQKWAHLGEFIEPQD